MQTIAHLVRHGEVYNPDNILYGRLPGYHLSSRGRSMAAHTAREFEDHDVTVLKASPLTRAQETAEPFVEVTGLEVQPCEQIIEAQNQFEGMRKGFRTALEHPEMAPLLRSPSIPSWGEPYAVIASRMMEAVYDARREAEGHEAILISHQLPIVMVQRVARGQRLAHNPLVRHCGLASVTSLVFEGTRIVDCVYSTPAKEI